MYQDLIDWLRRMDAEGFNERSEVEDYIRSHQNGAIYHQQRDALDFYFGAEQPEPVETPQTTIDRIREGEVSNAELERETEPVVESGQPQPPLPNPIPDTEAERQSTARRLYNSIRRLFGA